VFNFLDDIFTIGANSLFHKKERKDDDRNTICIDFLLIDRPSSRFHRVKIGGAFRLPSYFYTVYYIYTKLQAAL